MICPTRSSDESSDSWTRRLLCFAIQVQLPVSSTSFVSGAARPSSLTTLQGPTSASLPMPRPRCGIQLLRWCLRSTPVLFFIMVQEIQASLWTIEHGPNPLSKIEDGFASDKAPTMARGDQSCIEQPSCAPPAWVKVVTLCQCRTSGGRWQKAMINRVDAVAQIVEVFFLEGESIVKLIPFNHFKEPRSLWSLRPG